MALNTKQFLLWVEKEYPDLTKGLRGYFDETGTFPNQWEEETILQYEKAKNQLLHEEYKKEYKDKLIKNITNSSKCKFKYQRRFIKMYTVSLDELKLSVEELGVITLLQRYLAIDGSGLIIIPKVNSIATMSKHFGISRNKLSNVIRSLESKNVIKLEKNR